MLSATVARVVTRAIAVPEVALILFDRISDLARGAFGRLVPEDLFLPGSRLRAPESYEHVGLPGDRAEAQVMAAQVGPGLAIDLIIPQNALLSQRMILPQLDEKQTGAAIGLRLRQGMPRQGQGLVWRWLRDGADECLVYLCKEEQLSALLFAFAAAGRPVAAIRSADRRVPAFHVAGRVSRARRFWNRAAAACVVGTLIWSLGSLWSEARRLEGENAGLAERVSALQERAIAARDAAHDIARTGADVSAALDRLELDRDWLSVIAALTASLPDEVWVSELTLSEATLYLSGFTTGEVRDALDAIGSQPFALSARLDGPIFPDPVTGEKRFQAIVTLTAGTSKG